MKPVDEVTEKEILLEIYGEMREIRRFLYIVFALVLIGSFVMTLAANG